MILLTTQTLSIYLQNISYSICYSINKQVMQHGFTTTSLPPNFADEVMELELEMELNQKVQIERVNRLIELYTAAVEYYESVKSNNYIVFKNKIVSLMLKPNVTRLAEAERRQEQREEKGTEESESSSVEKQASEARREKMDNSLQIQSKEHELSARKMMVGTDTKLENVHRRINNEISKQELRIEERLRMRKGGKGEVASIGSTESDPKEKEAREKDELFTFETILESEIIMEGQEQQQQREIGKKIEIPLEPQGNEGKEEKEDKKAEEAIEEVAQKEKGQENSKENSKEKDKEKERGKLEIKQSKKKAKKQVLTLKPNEKPAALPDEYSIPF